MDATQRQSLIDFFFYRLWVYGQSVASITIKVPQKDQLDTRINPGKKRHSVF